MHGVTFISINVLIVQLIVMPSRGPRDHEHIARRKRDTQVSHLRKSGEIDCPFIQIPTNFIKTFFKAIPK